MAVTEAVAAPPAEPSRRLDRPRRTMYTYIVERTQIYLSREQAAALDREAKRSGTTRSHLIREAIDRTYLAAPDRGRIRAALRRSAGAWTGRTETGEAFVERIRGTGRMARLWSWRDDEATGETAGAGDRE